MPTNIPLPGGPSLTPERRDPPLFAIDAGQSVVTVWPLRDIAGFESGAVSHEIDAIDQHLRSPDIRALIIDLERLPFFGSMMLTALIRVSRRAKQAARPMAIINANANQRDLFRISHLDEVWPVFATRDEALARLLG